jgi:hypothetical protein
MRPSNLSVFTSLLLFSGALAAEITLPAETERLRPSLLPGYVLATADCLICHSPDYLRTQPVLPRATWQAEVLKMQKVYGAPIPATDVDPLVDYLVKTYGAERSAASAPPARKSSADHSR